MVSRPVNWNQLQTALRSCARHFLETVLPSACVLCGMSAPGANLCPPCRRELPRNVRCCPACGLPMPPLDAALCGRCLRRQPCWDHALAALLYRPPVDWLVQRFKFRRDFACGQVLAEALLEAVEQRGPPWPDLLLWVPLHRRRQLQRTFNQAELLARQCGRALDIPLRNALVRVRHTAAQSGLARIERRRNTRGAFKLKRRHASTVRNARVALVDDVLTTGATLSECAGLLRKAGAAGVEVWVAARAEAP